MTIATPDRRRAGDAGGMEAATRRRPAIAISRAARSRPSAARRTFRALRKSRNCRAAANRGAADLPLLAALVFVCWPLFLWRWAAGKAFIASARGICSARLWDCGALFSPPSRSSMPPIRLNPSNASRRRPDVTFLAPVQQASSALTVEVANLPAAEAGASTFGRAWPALLALVVWIVRLVARRQIFQGGLGNSRLDAARVGRAAVCPTARRHFSPSSRRFCCCTS